MVRSYRQRSMNKICPFRLELQGHTTRSHNKVIHQGHSGFQPSASSDPSVALKTSTKCWPVAMLSIAILVMKALKQLTPYLQLLI